MFFEKFYNIVIIDFCIVAVVVLVWFELFKILEVLIWELFNVLKIGLVLIDFCIVEIVLGNEIFLVFVLLVNCVFCKFL